MNEAMILYIFIGLMLFNLLVSVVYAVGVNQLRTAVRRAIKEQLSGNFGKPR